MSCLAWLNPVDGMRSKCFMKNRQMPLPYRRISTIRTSFGNSALADRVPHWSNEFYTPELYIERISA